MSAAQKRASGAAQESEARPFLEAFDEVSEAVESGAGLPSVTRAAGRALGASVIVLDSSSSVLAVACESTEDERAVLAGEGGSEKVELKVADEVVGHLHYRPHGAPPAGHLLRLVSSLIGLELERSQAPERATEAAVGDFLADLLGRKVTDRENILARAQELGLRPGRRRRGDRGPRPAPAARGGRLARARPDDRRARARARSSAARSPPSWSWASAPSASW